jgi:nucleoside-diphosphate-sugar epimerase
VFNLADYISNDIFSNPNSFDLSSLKYKKILITGASGIVGTYLVATIAHLLKKNVLNAFLDVLARNEPEPFYKEIAGHPNIRIIPVDLCAENSAASLETYDLIIHAASYGQPQKFMSEKIKTLQLNTAVVFSLFGKLNPNGCFIFFSTSEVYSGLTEPPFRENQIGNTNTDHSRACYIEAKRCGEAICNAFREQGFKTHSLRLSLAYGPGARADDRRVLNSFIQKGLAGRIDLMDGGEAKRTYCYIADVNWIVWRIIQQGGHGVYNVGGESRTTIGQLAKRIGSFLDVPVFFPTKFSEVAGAPDDVQLDMSRFQDELGKICFTSFENGLSKTIAWQRIYNKG